jgi:hypothetical protein
MQIREADLPAFARSRPAPAAGEAVPQARVPVPHLPWRTRLLLPVVLLGTAGAIFVYTARDLVGVTWKTVLKSRGELS